VEREQEQLARPLAQRLRPDQFLELGNHAGRFARLERGVQPVLVCRQPQVLEPRGRSLGGPTPEVQGLAQLVACAGRVAVREPLPTFRRELFEALEVELALAYAEQVAGRPRYETFGAELLPQLRDVDLQRLRRGRRRFVRPELVDQTLARDN